MSSDLRVYCLTLMVFFAATNPLCTRAQESTHDKLMAGQQVAFDDQAPEDTRTIKSEWIKDVILKHKPVLIVGAVIHGDLDLRYVTVEQEIEFEKCKFDSWVDFSYATFKRNFGAGETLFSHGVTFESANFAGSLGLSGSIFTGPTVFQNIRVDGRFTITKARFAIRYEDEPDVPLSVSFHHSRFFNVTSFGATVFEGRVFFDGSHFADQADFWRTSFQQVSFDSSAFDKDCNFETTHFGGPLSLRDAIFHTVFFSPLGTVPEGSDAHSSKQFNDTVDLRGWTYTTFGGGWKPLFLRENAESRFAFYDRQPFTQLESSYRKEGRDESADAVYLIRRKLERKLRWKLSFSRWLGDLVPWSVNYGIEAMWRLAAVSFCLIISGTLFFRQPGAIEGKGSVGIWSALAVALKWFLPLDIPLRRDWTLGTEPLKLFNIPKLWIRPDTYATLLLRVPGYIVIPFAILALSGYLRYVGQVL